MKVKLERPFFSYKFKLQFNAQCEQFPLRNTELQNEPRNWPQKVIPTLYIFLNKGTRSFHIDQIVSNPPIRISFLVKVYRFKILLRTEPFDPQQPLARVVLYFVR